MNGGPPTQRIIGLGNGVLWRRETPPGIFMGTVIGIEEPTPCNWTYEVRLDNGKVITAKRCEIEHRASSRPVFIDYCHPDTLVHAKA